ncbi:GNAT family N-acetyltransferase [Georgenia sp. Z1344]|uniref:GNAT family N-acetyltransferase n=1 Tax=Georgenia sp. Z1344 TaxID=3416706 RepID=UPI003CF500E3
MPLHATTASPERFARLDRDPDEDLARVRRVIAAGRVAPDDLVVVADDSGDVGRAFLMTLEDGTRVAQAFRLVDTHPESIEVVRLLLDAVAARAAAGGADRVHAVVTDDEPAPAARRAALAAAGWLPDGDRLELSALPAPGDLPPGVVEVDPTDNAVLDVLAAAMADSLDDYDRDQVAELGPAAAARAYRDMLVSSGNGTAPWLGHVAGSDLKGVAALEGFDTDWCLGYLGVVPPARRRGVGAALTAAMLSQTARAEVPLATASVAVGNTPVRATLERRGFTVRTRRTDFVRHLGPSAPGAAPTAPVTERS